MGMVLIGIDTVVGLPLVILIFSEWWIENTLKLTLKSDQPSPNSIINVHELINYLSNWIKYGIHIILPSGTTLSDIFPSEIKTEANTIIYTLNPYYLHEKQYLNIVK